MFLRAFSTKFAFNYSPLNQSSFNVFAVFVDSRGGTPGKRILESLFVKVRVLIFAPQKRVHSMFLEVL